MPAKNCVEFLEKNLRTRLSLRNAIVTTMTDGASIM